MGAYKIVSKSDSFGGASLLFYSGDPFFGFAV
jgi:hypothetical protein